MQLDNLQYKDLIFVFTKNIIVATTQIRSSIFCFFLQFTGADRAHGNGQTSGSDRRSESSRSFQRTLPQRRSGQLQIRNQLLHLNR